MRGYLKRARQIRNGRGIENRSFGLRPCVAAQGMSSAPLFVALCVVMCWPCGCRAGAGRRRLDPDTPRAGRMLRHREGCALPPLASRNLMEFAVWPSSCTLRYLFGAISPTGCGQRGPQGTCRLFSAAPVGEASAGHTTSGVYRRVLLLGFSGNEDCRRSASRPAHERAHRDSPSMGRGMPAQPMSLGHQPGTSARALPPSVGLCPPPAAAPEDRGDETLGTRRPGWRVLGSWPARVAPGYPCVPGCCGTPFCGSKSTGPWPFFWASNPPETQFQESRSQGQGILSVSLRADEFREFWADESFPIYGYIALLSASGRRFPILRESLLPFFRACRF